MIGEGQHIVLAGSITVPTDFCGQHFKGNPVLSQGHRMHSHDMQGCRWWEINTASGTYDWATLDAKVALWGSRPWTYCMFGTPTWASARPAEAHAYGLGRMAEPSSMTYLSNFVTALLARYPTLDRIEVWNEPDIPGTSGLYWYSGTVAKFVEMCQAIYTAGKAARPAIKITGPGTTYYLSSPNWLDAFFVAGGAAYLDEYSIHGYQLQYGTPHKALLGAILNLDYLKKSISKNGADQKPISISEFGQINPTPPNLSDADVIAAYKRAMVVAAGFGLTSASWYQYDDGTFGYSTRPAVVSAIADFVTLFCGSTLSNVRFVVSNSMTVHCNINGTAYVF